MLDKWSGENIGTDIARLADVRTDPYSLDNLPNMIPTPGSVMAFPLKASVYMNSMRSGWAGFKYLYGLDNKFTDASLRNQYRMTTVNGLLGDIISTGKATVERFFRGETMSGAPMHRSKSWKFVDSPGKEGRFLALNSKAWEAGILDRFVAGKSHINSALRNFSEAGHLGNDKLKEFIDDNRFVDELIRHKYLIGKEKSYDSLYSERKDRLKSLEEGLGFFEKRKARVDNLRMSGLPMKRPVVRTPGMSEAAFRYFQDAETQRYKASLRKQKTKIPSKFGSYDKMIRDRVASFGDLLRGKVSRDDVAIWRDDKAGMRFMPVKASLPWNKPKYARQYTTTYEAFLRTLSDNGVARTAAAETAAHQAAIGSVWRTKMIKMAKPYLAAAYVVPAIADAAVSATRMINETIERTASTMRSVTAMEFGSDNLMQSSRMASERQRAISAIQNAQMNARYLLGSEATMYH